MAVTLSRNNRPPARSRILLGEQVRDTDQRSIAHLNNELWSLSGEGLAGLLYDRDPLSTTSTLYSTGASGWLLDRWQPVLTVSFNHATAGQTTLMVDAYVRNVGIRILGYNVAWTLITSTSADSTSNTPQWISIRSVLAGLSPGSNRIFQIQMRRNAFDASGVLYHFGAKMGATTAAQIPVS